MDRSRAEVYHHPKPWSKTIAPLTGFQYDVVLPFCRPIEGLKPTPSELILIAGAPPKQEKFYGVGNYSTFYEWTEPDE